jgi:CRP/FNR family cyclic AMP-dependent transcriptional regulator
MAERLAQARAVRGDRSRVKMSKPVDALLRAHARKRTFKRGTVVVADGEPAGGLWFVESGAIAVTGRSAGQRDFIFRFRQPGEWFGETTLLDGLPWLYTHVASVKTTALHVPHREAQRLMALHPELRSELVRITCARLRATAEYVEEIIVPDLPARLAYHLLVIGRESANGLVPGRQLEVHLTQSVLASLLGATREAVGRHLVRWRDAGWIGLRYGRVTILDPAVLEQIANGERSESELVSSPLSGKALVRAS